MYHMCNMAVICPIYAIGSGIYMYLRHKISVKIGNLVLNLPKVGQVTQTPYS